jgi:glutamate N-acetyltransferase/amino-acid N-acetyltransferase
MAGHDILTSPLALPLPAMPAVPGVRVASGRAAIRYKDRDDVTVMAFPTGTTVAGVFTRNRCPGAPVDWCRAPCPAARRVAWW